VFLIRKLFKFNLKLILVCVLVTLIRGNYFKLVPSFEDNFALKTDLHGCGLRVILVAGESGDAEC